MKKEYIIVLLLIGFIIFMKRKARAQGTGTFEIVSLDRARSYDKTNGGIVTVGDVTWEDASTYKLIKKGEIKRNENGIYEITKPTKIQLIRAEGDTVTSTTIS